MTATPALPRGVYRLRPVFGLSSFVGLQFWCFDAYAVLSESTVTIVDKLFYYSSHLGRVATQQGALKCATYTVDACSLSASRQTQCGGKLHFKAPTGRYEGSPLAACGRRGPGESPGGRRSSPERFTHTYTHLRTHVSVTAGAVAHGFACTRGARGRRTSRRKGGEDPRGLAGSRGCLVVQRLARTGRNMVLVRPLHMLTCIYRCRCERSSFTSTLPCTKPFLCCPEPGCGLWTSWCFRSSSVSGCSDFCAHRAPANLLTYYGI